MKTNYSWFCVVIGSVLIAAMPAMADDDPKLFPSKNPWGETKNPWAKTKVILDTTGADQAMTNAVTFSVIQSLTVTVGQLEKNSAKVNELDEQLKEVRTLKEALTLSELKKKQDEKDRAVFDCSKKIVELEEKTNRALNSHWFTEKQKKEIRTIANEVILGADEGDIAKIRKAAKELVTFNDRLIAIEKWRPGVDGDIKNLKDRVSVLEGATDANVTAERGKIVESAQTAVEIGELRKKYGELATTVGEIDTRAENSEKRANAAVGEAKNAASNIKERLTAAEKKTDESLKAASSAVEIAKGKADVGIISAGLSGFVAKDLYVAGVTFEYTILKGRNRFGIGGGIGYYWDTESIHKDERIKARAPLFADASIRYTRQLKSLNWLELGGGVMSYFAGQPNSEHFGFGVFVGPQFNIPTPKSFEVGIGPRYGVTYGWGKRPMSEPPGLPAGARFQQYEHKGDFGWWNVSLDLTFRF